MTGVRIHLPAALRDLVPGTGFVVVDAASVPEALEALVERYPDLGRMLFSDPGVLRPHVNVFVESGETGARADEGPLGEGDEIRIVPSIAGG
ncbi:MAG: MoaD/ThiS family protein [Gemmatimonadota bacterium]|nr:MoaD/ThiS family protein [Gemmatimonadota bacterium]